MRHATLWFLTLLSFWHLNAFSACSPYITQATLNEVFHKTSGGPQIRAYLEIELIDPLITNAIYDEWTIRICAGFTCADIDVSLIDDSNFPWVYADKNDFNRYLIDFSNGFDLSLLDANGDMIDYIQVQGYSKQVQSCDYSEFAYVYYDPLPYGIPGTVNGTKSLQRIPDGTGPWLAQQGNPTDTPGDNNDDSTIYPFLVISDDTVNQGDAATFTVSILDVDGNPATSAGDTTFYYKTLNDSAVAPTHYTEQLRALATIPAGSHSITLPQVSTVNVGDSTTRQFSMYMYGSAYAVISDSIGIGTIIPAGKLQALYRFEQTDFDSGIFDTSGNNNHAENIFGGLSTPDGKYCRGFESESWNDYPDITDSFRSSLDLDDDIGLKGTISFWFNSSINWQNGDERVLFDASTTDDNPDKYFVLEIQEDGRLKFNFEDSDDGDYSLVEPIVNRVSGQWYYLTVTWDYVNNDFAIYVDANPVIQQSHNTNGIMSGLGQIVFGDNSSTYTATGNADPPSPYSSRGNYDEVRIYNKVLTQSEIQTDMNDNNGCIDVVHHFVIDTINGQGLTCQPKLINIKACANDTCTIPYTTAVDVELSINGALNRIITVTDGDTDATFSYTTANVATLSLDQNFQCLNGSPTDCDVTFSETGFVFNTIPTQLSGKPSNTGYNDTTLTLKAIETDTLTGACVGAFPDGGDVDVNLSYTCDGGSCTDLLALTNNGNSYNLTTSPTARTLRFSTDSTAVYTLEYPHAAKFIINAQTDVEVTNDVGDVVIKDFSTSSNAFVERPFGLKLAFNPLTDPNPLSIDSSGSVFKKAGETFSMTATAMQWVNGQDADDDGIPDDFTVFNSNTAVAENFYNETLVLAETLLLPDPDDNGTNGVFTVESVDNDFIASVVNGSYNYSEVGIIQLDANLSDNDYLGVGDILGQVTNVGRFIPDHFELAITLDGTLAATCEAGSTPQSYVYSGQMTIEETPAEGLLRYGDLPTFTVTAKNVDDVITKNYTGDFMKLTPGSVTHLEQTQDGTKLGKDGLTLLSLTADIKDVVITDRIDVNAKGEGVIDIAYNIDDHFVYTHEANAEVIPFPADINLAIESIIDTDLVTALDADGDDTNTIILTLEPTPLEVRFGRLHIAESYGPETSNLMQTISTQYLSAGTTYITNGDDNCTAFNKDQMVLSNNTIDPNGHDGSPATGLMVSGITTALFLNATGEQGKVNVGYQTLEWLKHDWDKSDADETPDQDPSAIATFGLFRGNDRIIYWREK